LARIGGDEFVAVLGDLEDVQAAVPVLTRLLSTAAQLVVINEVALQVSASIGVTFYPQSQEVEADQLLRQADQSMYQAKLAGKNRYSIFDAQEDSGIRSFHESIERIRQGLANGEFVMHYQPKVNMLTGAVIGAEALVRWQHPQSGLLAPGLFLPAIDNHPLAVEVGEWVIDTTLTQIEDWQAQGISLAVSVNVGARQIQQPDFVARLRKILEAHPLVNPSSLEIEILETSALEDLERVSQVIEDCRALGVTFAMDDFGTGYSSLTYLRRLRVNLLKIDQSFVRDMLDDVEDLTILQGVIGLAKSFRRSAIAEGVETVAHGKLLLQLGCELAQGYGIARPMPAGELPHWLSHWKPDASWSEESVIAPEHVPYLYAGIEHRAWVAAMGAHLRGERLAPPNMDSHQCNFGKWMDGDSRLDLGGIPSLQLANNLHQEVHALANELVRLQANGSNAQALAQFPELERLRDLLLAQLDVLTHSKPLS
jgi:EAL domain-containing protein (putative c-di-GMP-specific phosphodiesterase class I)